MKAEDMWSGFENVIDGSIREKDLDKIMNFNHECCKAILLHFDPALDTVLAFSNFFLWFIIFSLERIFPINKFFTDLLQNFEFFVDFLVHFWEKYQWELVFQTVSRYLLRIQSFLSGKNHSVLWSQIQNSFWQVWLIKCNSLYSWLKNHHSSIAE